PGVANVARPARRWPFVVGAVALLAAGAAGVWLHLSGGPRGAGARPEARRDGGAAPATPRAANGRLDVSVVEPIAGVSISVRSADGTVAGVATTGADGTAHVGRLPDGTYRVLGSLAGHARAE